MTTAVILCSTTPAPFASNDYSLRQQHNCFTGTVFWKAAALADLLPTQKGLLLPHARTCCSSFPGRLTKQITVTTVHRICLHTAKHVEASPFAMCGFVTFHFSNVGKAEKDVLTSNMEPRSPTLGLNVRTLNEVVRTSLFDLLGKT